MKIKVKLFANLMEYLPANTDGNSVELTVTDSATIHNIIDKIGIPREEVQIIMTNGEFCPQENRDTALSDGDVVSVWPSIQGG